MKVQSEAVGRRDATKDGPFIPNLIMNKIVFVVFRYVALMLFMLQQWQAFGPIYWTILKTVVVGVKPTCIYIVQK